MDRFANPKELAALSRRAQAITVKSLSDGVTIPVLVDLLSRLSTLAGVSAAGPCNQCTKDPDLSPIVTEIFEIWDALRSMDEPVRAQLLEREGCPFRTAEGCLLGERKPLYCRPKNPDQLARVHAVERGHHVGLVLLGLAYYQVHLLTELPKLLEEADEPEPSSLKPFSEGFQVFRESAGVPISRDEAIEEAKLIQGKREPSGFPPHDPKVTHACSLLPVAPLKTILAHFPRDTEHQRLFQLRVPYACSSEDEIDEWRARFLHELDEFVARGYDPANLIDGLVNHETFAIAYQGRNAKDLVEPYGTKLVGPAARAALPDLSEPIERRQSGKIRVGYIGRNLRNHNGGSWALGWIGNHAEDIETIALPLSPKTRFRHGPT